MAKKKVAEKPKGELSVKIAELQKKRTEVSPQEQIEIDKQIAELEA